MKPVPFSDIPEKYHAQIAYQLGHAQFHPSLAAGLHHTLSKQDAELSPLGQDEDEERSTGRFKVRITVFRAKLLDPDSCAGAVKFILDACRYDKLIRDDNPESIVLEVAQVKAKKENRGTLIEIERLP